MAREKLAEGVVHKVPTDLRRALISDNLVLGKWQSLTPLSRNEWICWNITVKQPKTRADHIKRTVTELKQGKRRPCCWIGCVHRKEKPLSPTQKWFIKKD